MANKSIAGWVFAILIASFAYWMYWNDIEEHAQLVISNELLEDKIHIYDETHAQLMADFTNLQIKQEAINLERDLAIVDRDRLAQEVVELYGAMDAMMEHMIYMQNFISELDAQQENPCQAL